MSRKHVVCSFDYTNDKHYYYLLTAWNSNPYINFYISDCTPSEIHTQSVATIKNVLSRKIGEAKYMVAIVGKHSNDKHPDHVSIGYRNWQSYEIEKNSEKGNGLVIVQLDPSCAVPDVCYGKGAKWVTGFDKEKIQLALNQLSR